MGNCCLKQNTGELTYGARKDNSLPSKLFSEAINVEDFIIKKVIGRGTFGKVFLVRK